MMSHSEEILHELGGCSHQPIIWQPSPAKAKLNNRCKMNSVGSDDDKTQHVHLDGLTLSSTTSETASAVSPCSSDSNLMLLVSPPPTNIIVESTLTPSGHMSLTPPLYSERINRAIRTAEYQLDAAVDDVQRFISEGCPDSNSVTRRRLVLESPDSDYSDDLNSPRELPDFRSPTVLHIKHFGVKSSSSDDECHDDATKESNSSSGDLKQKSDKPCTEYRSRNYARTVLTESRDDNEGLEDPEAMELRTLRLVDGKFQVWPPLKHSDRVKLRRCSNESNRSPLMRSNFR